MTHCSIITLAIVYNSFHLKLRKLNISPCVLRSFTNGVKSSEAQHNRRQKPFERGWHCAAHPQLRRTWALALSRRSEQLVEKAVELYAETESNRMQKYHHDPGFKITEFFTCVPQMTLYSAVFASPSRVRLAYKNGVAFSRAAYQYAAGRYATVATLAAARDAVAFSRAAYQYAAGRYATVATLAAARDAGMQFTVFTMKGAAECNELAVVQFLHAQGCRWHYSAAAAAADRGDLEVLRWIREHGCKWNEHTILSNAASSGNIEVAAWVKQQAGTVYRQFVMTAAAKHGGHTAMCEYLHAEQCPWGSTACEAAAFFGHVDTLRWLQDNGCPWEPEKVCEAAGGSVDIMLRLQQQGIVEFTPELLTRMLNTAGAYNKLAAAQWLRQQGTEWPAVLKHMGSSVYEVWPQSWSGETLAWARAEGCTSPTQ
jgi:hypothetical protein